MDEGLTHVDRRELISGLAGFAGGDQLHGATLRQSVYQPPSEAKREAASAQARLRTT